MNRNKNDVYHFYIYQIIKLLISIICIPLRLEAYPNLVGKRLARYARLG